MYTDEIKSAILQAAKALGTSPEDLATVISYETGGKFSPSVWGGKNNNYLGLIQFGPEERAKYGVNPKQTIPQQMGAVVSFLKDRGFKPGMGIKDLYSTINAGSPGRYLASDGPGQSVAGHVAKMISGDHFKDAVEAFRKPDSTAPASGAPVNINPLAAPATPSTTGPKPLGLLGLGGYNTGILQKFGGPSMGRDTNGERNGVLSLVKNLLSRNQSQPL